MQSSKGKISKCKVHLDKPMFANSAMFKLLQTIKKDELAWVFKFFFKNFYPHWIKERDIR